MDKAIINYVNKHCLKIVAEDNIKVDQIPFDFNRHKSTVVIKNKENHRK